MKVITLCGSLKFKKEMMIVAEKMALEGKCIITPVYPVLGNCRKTRIYKKINNNIKNVNIFVSIF